MKNLLVPFFLLLSTFLISQRPFIELQTEANYQCLQNELPYVNQILNDVRYEAVYPVKINPINEGINDHKLKIELPGQSVALELPIRFVDYTDDTNFTIDGGGTIGPGNPCLQSNANFAFSDRGNGACGMIRYDDENYQLLRVCENQYFLVKDDISKYGKCEDGSSSSVISESNSPNLENRSNNSISILILYTPDAREQAGSSFTSKIDFDIDQMNINLRNSFKDNYRVDILDIIQLNNTTVTQSGRAARDYLRTAPEVVAQRNYYGADLVYVYLSDINLPSGFFGASSLFLYNQPDGFISIGNISASANKRTFAHENFHNLGCQHDDQSPIITNSYARAAWGQGDGGRTVMYSGANMELDQLSMPFPGIDGNINGDVDRDNARQLDEGIPNISAFKQENVDIFKAEIAGTLTGDNNSLIDLTMGTSDCYGTSAVVSVTYSTDGITYLNVPTSYIQGLYIVDFPMPLNRHIYFKVTMSCTYNGVTVIDDWVHRVQNSDYDPCEPTGGISLSINSNDIEDYSVSPNPVLKGGKINLNFISNFDQNITVSFVTENGLKVYSKQKYYTQGKHKEVIDLKQEYSGVLLSLLKTKNETKTKKIIIND